MLVLQCVAIIIVVTAVAAMREDVRIQRCWSTAPLDVGAIIPPLSVRVAVHPVHPVHPHSVMSGLGKVEWNRVIPSSILKEKWRLSSPMTMS